MATRSSSRRISEVTIECERANAVVTSRAGEPGGIPGPAVSGLVVLLAVRTMAMHSAASYDRLARWVQFSPKRVPKLLADIADHPGFNAPSGLIASTSLIILLVVVLFLIFKKKRWL